MEQLNPAASLLCHADFRPLPSVHHHLRRRPISTRGNVTPSIRTSAVRPPSAAAPTASPSMVEQPGGKMVVELVGAFNDLTERMGAISTSASSRLLFKALKLSIPLLHPLPFSADGRPPLSRALSVACLLADLQMDAEVISAGVLREALEVGAITMHEVKAQIGTGTSHLLHESLRIRNVPSKVDILDDDSASALRKFCLTYYDIRALILELALKLDAMRHLDYLPSYHQQITSLEVMKIYAPLAHAVGADALSQEMEDLSFWYLFPHSYLYVDTWLKSHGTERKPLIEVCRYQLLEALEADAELAELVDSVSIQGRYKSRFSTMKKLLRDGRKPEEVNDLLGLRVILNPRSGVKRGHKACYRTHEVIRTLWKEIPRRTKDYISRPKGNGYRSLHVAVDVSEDGRARPLMEIQIRTTEMDKLAAGGAASHSLYKGGLTDPGEAKRLKAIMMAAAELAALRLRDLPSANHRVIETNCTNRAFRLLDKNGDGRISIEELTEVMEELGAGGEDAQELMRLLDENSDGSLSSDEFDLFQRQVRFMRNLEDRDDHYRTMLGEKLQMAADSTGLIQLYRKELGNKLALFASDLMGEDDKTSAMPEKFGGQNFKHWQARMKFWLTTLRLFSVIEGPEPDPEEYEPGLSWALENRRCNDYLCHGKICSRLEDNPFDIYSQIPLAKELWDALTRKYNTEDAGLEKYNVGRFLEFKMVEGQSVVEQTHQLQLIVHELNQSGIPVHEKFEVAAII